MGGSSAIPPTASLFRERFIYDEQPFLRGYERATGRFWRKAAARQKSQGQIAFVTSIVLCVQPPFAVRPYPADTVAKVENRAMRKILRKSPFGRLNCYEAL